MIPIFQESIDDFTDESKNIDKYIDHIKSSMKIAQANFNEDISQLEKNKTTKLQVLDMCKKKMNIVIKIINEEISNLKSNSKSEEKLKKSKETIKGRLCQMDLIQKFLCTELKKDNDYTGINNKQEKITNDVISLFRHDDLLQKPIKSIKDIIEKKLRKLLKYDTENNKLKSELSDKIERVFKNFKECKYTKEIEGKLYFKEEHIKTIQNNITDIIHTSINKINPNPINLYNQILCINKSNEDMLKKQNIEKELSIKSRICQTICTQFNELDGLIYNKLYEFDKEVDKKINYDINLDEEIKEYFKEANFNTFKDLKKQISELINDDGDFICRIQDKAENAIKQYTKNNYYSDTIKYIKEQNENENLYNDMKKKTLSTLESLNTQIIEDCRKLFKMKFLKDIEKEKISDIEKIKKFKDFHINFTNNLRKNTSSALRTYSKLHKINFLQNGPKILGTDYFIYTGQEIVDKRNYFEKNSDLFEFSKLNKEEQDFILNNFLNNSPLFESIEIADKEDEENKNNIPIKEDNEYKKNIIEEIRNLIFDKTENGKFVVKRDFQGKAINYTDIYDHILYNDDNKKKKPKLNEAEQKLLDEYFKYKKLISNTVENNLHNETPAHKDLKK